MRQVFAIILAVLAYFIATDIYTPSMPEIARDFEATSSDVQKSVSYFMFGAVASCFLAGLFADQVGKKRFLISGMSVAAFGSLISLLSPSLEWLVFGRFLQGLGGGVSHVIAFASIHQLYEEKQATKIFGLLGATITIAPAVAPIIGGIIGALYGWHVVFTIIMLIFMAMPLCLLKYMPDALNISSRHSPAEVIRSYKTILSSKAFLSYALISPLHYSVVWYYITFLPFYAQNILDVSASYYGLMISFLICWFAAGSIIGGRLIVRIGLHNSILLGISLAIAGALMLWLTAMFAPYSVWAICLSLAIFLFGHGLSFPGSVTGSLNLFTSFRTRASSLRSLLVTIFAFLGSFFAELMDETQLSSFAIYVSICSVLAFAAYNLRLRKIE
jgi:DHA1 family bicyclomycin/chloramphenicol resistance-like MFS transporter